MEDGEDVDRSWIQGDNLDSPWHRVSIVKLWRPSPNSEVVAHINSSRRDKVSR